MFCVRYSEKKATVELCFSYLVTPETDREFKMNRELTESIGKTFEKLISNLNKQIESSAKGGKKNKVANAEFIKNNSQITVALYDSNNKIVSKETPNDEAWKDDYKVRINDRLYEVSVNLPCLQRLALPKVLISNMPVIAVTESEDASILNTSRFSWYQSKTKTNTGPWELINEGVNLRFIILSDDSFNKYVKLICVPSDGKRDGVPIEVMSLNPVQKMFELDELPMTEKHKMTTEKFNDTKLRVVSYNLLAKAYGDSAGAKINFYPYCPNDYVEFKYRRSLLIHEMINYNADVLFLQECDEEFFEIDIKNSLFILGYDGFHRIKGTAKEGEAILYRKDRFKFVSSHDIKITEKMLSTPEYNSLWDTVTKKDSQLKLEFEQRNTLFQVMLLESLEHEGNCILLANTHLYFHARADFIRLIQTIVSMKHLESIANELKEQGKKVSILFGGDFNSDPPSYAVNYMLRGEIALKELKQNERDIMENECDKLTHSLKLDTSYEGFLYTNYLEKFHSILDYIFYDRTKFSLTRVLPLPTHEQVTKYTALPSRLIPSDHLALVFELEWLFK